VRILLTNDDGYFTEAYQILGLELQKHYDVTMISPEQNCSGISHAFTLREPVYYSAVESHKNPLGLENFYSFSGTPVDCVKFCLLEFMRDRPPDLVISGINPGANMACDVLYSGTVAAAIEGSINGCPSIAISYNSLELQSQRVQEVIDWFLSFLKAHEDYLMSSRALLNINYPALPKEKIQGVRVTRVGKRGYCDSYVRRVTPQGREYFWLTGELDSLDEPEDSDKRAVLDGYIAITPLKIDYSDDHGVENLRRRMD
jgi:5'-nucleotidase